MLCARVMRGSSSIAATSMPAAARPATSSVWPVVLLVQTNNAPRGIRARTSAPGIPTANTTPAPAKADAASGAISAPAA